MGSMEIHKRLSAHVNHKLGTGVIRVTEGNWRFERPMKPDELELATRFDRHQKILRPVKVVIDLNDGTWMAKPKARTSGKKTAANNYGRGPENKQIKTIRQRQLAALITAHAKAQDGTGPDPLAPPVTRFLSPGS
jgi:hypothetical protein